jgi:hypothetical protein
MKPFLQGRPVQKGVTLRPLCSDSAEAIARAKAGSSSKGVNVETVKQGEKVVKIIVTCSCGERIEIDCLYPAGG